MADAVTEREVGDSSGHWLTLRGDAAKPWLRRRERPNWRLAVPAGRLGGKSDGKIGGFRSNPDGPPEYNSGLRFDKRETPGKTGKRSRMGGRNGGGRRVINEHGPAAYLGKAKWEMSVSARARRRGNI